MAARNVKRSISTILRKIEGVHGLTPFPPPFAKIYPYKREMSEQEVVHNQHQYYFQPFCF